VAESLPERAYLLAERLESAPRAMPDGPGTIRPIWAVMFRATVDYLS
jgi:hypothetical protein